MAKAPQPASRRDDDIIEGQIVEATTKALAKSGGEDFSSIAELNESEINMQVRFAQENPRSMERAMRNIMELATLDTETAMECRYALPRGRDDDGKAKVIEGPSIRLAELIFQQWGNNRCGSRILKVDRKDKVIIAQGVYHDLETNSFTTSEVRRRISSKSGALFNDDMIVVTGNAASSIALRNAIFRGIPKPIWRKVYHKVCEVIRGDEKSLGARRVDLLMAFKTNLDIKPATVYAMLGVTGEQDIGLDELVSAAGFYSALRNNEVTVEDLLNEVKGPVIGAKTLGGAFGGQEGAKAADAGDHDPATGEIKEAPPKADPKPTSPKAKAEGADVVIEGKAPAGVIHFLADAPGLNPSGKRTTFKDGERWASAKPSGDIPIYTELADEPAPAEEGEQGQGEGLAQPDSETSQETSAGPATETSSTESMTEAHSPESSDGGDEVEFPDAEEQEDEDEVAQSTEAEALDEPEEFTDFRERVSSMDSWLTVKAALKGLRATEAYKVADGVTKKAIRLAGRDVVEALRETGADPVDPKSDPEYFSLWLDGAEAPEVDPVWAALTRSKAYQALADATKDALADAAEKARG